MTLARYLPADAVTHIATRMIAVGPQTQEESGGREAEPKFATVTELRAAFERQGR